MDEIFDLKKLNTAAKEILMEHSKPHFLGCNQIEFRIPQIYSSSSYIFKC